MYSAADSACVRACVRAWRVGRGEVQLNLHVVCDHCLIMGVGSLPYQFADVRISIDFFILGESTPSRGSSNATTNDIIVRVPPEEYRIK